MKYFTKKDLVIIGLFFLLVLISSSLFGLVDETSLEGRLPTQLAYPAGAGFALLITIAILATPVVHFTYGLAGGTTYEWYFAALPWITAIVYSLVLALVIGIYNENKKRGTVKKNAPRI